MQGSITQIFWLIPSTSQSAPRANQLPPGKALLETCSQCACTKLPCIDWKARSLTTYFCYILLILHVCCKFMCTTCLLGAFREEEALNP